MQVAGGLVEQLLESLVPAGTGCWMQLVDAQCGCRPARAHDAVVLFHSLMYCGGKEELRLLNCGLLSA